MESFPDTVRARAGEAARRFRFARPTAAPESDPRLPALAAAVREHRVVRIQAYQPREREVHPVALVCEPLGWMVEDDLAPDTPISLGACGDINISSKTFTRTPAMRHLPATDRR